MPDAKEVLDELKLMLTELKTNGTKKLDDAIVVRLAGEWVKAWVALKGPGNFGALKLSLIVRGKPGAAYPKNLAITWSEELNSDLHDLQRAISNNQDNPDPAALQAVQRAVTGLIQDYRNGYGKGSNQDKTFEHQLTKVLNAEETAIKQGNY